MDLKNPGMVYCELGLATEHMEWAPVQFEAQPIPWNRRGAVGMRRFDLLKLLWRLHCQEMPIVQCRRPLVAVVVGSRPRLLIRSENLLIDFSALLHPASLWKTSASDVCLLLILGAVSRSSILVRCLPLVE